MKNLKQRGFTLVELLLYMGFFSIILVVTLQMFGSVFDAQIESQATSSVATDGRFILSRFNYDMARAQSISDPTLQGIPNAALAIVIEGTTFTYSLDSGDLLLTDSSNSTIDQLNSEATSVSDLSFIRLAGGENGKDVIQLSFTLTSEAIRKTQKEIVTFQTTAGLR
ncbi:MAG: type II secretion system protein [Candidatus Levybacteria bacterium]|nr:type II secretion system protein [Candidatus Levybacteria bacterium]